MLVIKFFNKENEKLNTSSELTDVVEIPIEDILWIDIFKEPDSDLSKLEKYLNIRIAPFNHLKKIGHSSRFIENENELIINTSILIKSKKSLINKPISFILKDDFLISFHNVSNLSIDELQKEIDALKISLLDGKIIFFKIFEKILETDVDLIESITKEIDDFSKILKENGKLDENSIYSITHLQELLMILRRNILRKQRVISSISKSEYFSKKVYKKHISIIEKDINSLLEYTAFDFERLEYLQNTLMGLLNMKQNAIMKIFTIVSVIFLPPTLIASIYGMNFQDMPELNLPHAYPIAITTMLIFSLIALFYFKRKKWI